jgi:heavy metal sensor kinase
VRTKLTLTYTGIFALILTGFGVLSERALTGRLDDSTNDQLEQTAAGLRGYLRFESGKPTLAYDRHDPEESYFVSTATRYYEVFDAASGELLVRSPDLEFLGLEVDPADVKAATLRKPPFSEVESPRGRVRFHNYEVSDGSRAYWVQVGTSLAPAERTLREFRLLLFLLVPAGVLLAGAGGWWMARHALRPVEALAAAAREIGIRQLDRRLPLRGTDDELDRMADTFNQTFARLQAAVEQMKQFTAAISHELRTPLTALRGEAEVTLLSARSTEDYRRVLASQLEEFDKLSHMVNELLTLARAEAGEIHLAFQPLNFSELVRSLSEQMEPVAAYKGVSLSVEREPDVSVSGDAQWLERVVLNLLDNAIKYTPSGGSVQVRIHEQDGEAQLDVRDTGIGIPAEAVPHLHERFYRVDPSRSKTVDGAGLGLSLVHWIVTAHRGRVQVDSDPGRGSRFTVALPRTETPAHV